ncbi:MAG: xanthine dehydrogenase family protein subunit M [Gammaproteobacteria bacterium]|nr:MAG: xanthine dehydrogenase family protein subunit M [Gammaproteobacteria bacterium]
MYEFNYHRPASLDEARALLEGNAEAQLLAGGMTLLPTMKMRLARPSDLVDLCAIDELGGIREDGDGIVVGATVRHADVASSELVQQAIPVLAEVAACIGDAQVRNRGTLGGSVSNSDPAADYPAAVLGLDAVLRTDRREIAAADYFLGMFETALQEHEIMVSVRFRRPQQAAYVKFSNPASRYAVVGVLVARFDDGVRVAVTGAGPCAFRLAEFEAALGKDFSVAALDGLQVDAATFNGDLHASPEYRAHLVGIMAGRAVSQAGG